MSEARRLRRARLWATWGAAFVALVIYLSVTPDPVRAPTVDGFKTGHIVAYLWLMLWFGQVWPSWRARLVSAALLCGLGVALEYVQRETGYRTFSYADMVDDAIGVAIGLALLVTPLGELLAWAERLTARSPARSRR